MIPLARADHAALGTIDGLLFDLDDTLLSHGVLAREAYGALWDLHDAGVRLVAVTGRPSGWGEVIVRQWPIDGAVTENGAVFLVREGKGIDVVIDGTPAEVASRRARLDALAASVSIAFPHVRFADDVAARRTDVTWDIGERDTVDRATVDAIAAHVVAAGARTTRSSVHVHATFERDDKASGVVRFLAKRFGVDPGAALYRYAFIGDSGNDAACFAAFAKTFGVANVARYARSMSVPPRWIAPSPMGAGFVEVARVILEARRGGAAASPA